MVLDEAGDESICKNYTYMSLRGRTVLNLKMNYYMFCHSIFEIVYSGSVLIKENSVWSNLFFGFSYMIIKVPYTQPDEHLPLI